MRFSPHPLSLRQLQYLVAIAETGSFHGAAELCHVAQPSLSSQVAQAEQALGVQVFERDRRRVLLTAAGHEVLRRARAVLLSADDLLDAVARCGDPLAGPLRIGVIPTISPYLLPDVAPALRQAFSQLALTWQEDKTASLLSALQAGELDAALVALETDLGHVEYAVLGYDPFVLATAPQHPLSRGTQPLLPDELSGCELLLLAEGHCLRDQVLSACKRAHSSPFFSTSLPTLVQMVLSGSGVTLLPTLALPSENRRGELHLRAFAKPGLGRTLALAWRAGSATAPALRKIAAVMKQVIKELLKSPMPRSSSI
ncbi:MAG: LysR family transcriptional regulator [Myxococcales bacterium]|nr:LysR family transcriptional regulator [Myxococcales bacterium]